MKTPFILMTGAAMALALTAPAYADDNTAFIDQAGEANSALINQDYREGVVGTGAGENAAGAADIRILQDGANNALTVLQAGRRNQVGNRGTGIDQTSDRNALSITQVGTWNRVNQVAQTAEEGAAATLNTATVTQSYGTQDAQKFSQAVVTSITQTNIGDANAAANTLSITQTRIGAGIVGHMVGHMAGSAAPRIGTEGGVVQDGAGNTATIDQYGARSSVGLLSQTGSGNMALIQQAGAQDNSANGFDNIVGSVVQNTTDAGQIATIRQIGNGNVVGTVDQAGSGNTVTLVFEGNDNGVNGFTSGGFAAAAEFGAQADGLVPVGLASNVYQSGAGNIVGLTAEGSGNEFGFVQSGSGHTTGMVTILGSDNELAVVQSVRDNELAVTAWEGDRNTVALVQSGANNLTTLDLDGNDNAYGLSQTGSNSLTAKNTITLTVDGNDNGGPAGSAFSGAAQGIEASVMTTFGGLLFMPIDVPVTPGLIAQQGKANTLTLTVGGDADGGSSDTAQGFGNLFGALQIGDNNTIDVAQYGDANQVAIAQVGNFNVANFVQRGVGNIIGATQ